MQYGNDVIETTAYSNRLQPTAIGASLNGTSLLGLSLYYCQNQAPTCTNNNGNLIGQTISAGGPTYTQTYAYNDGLNRLTGASENSNAWYQNYSYDAYGNRATTGNYIPGQNQTPAALNYTNNQWPVFGYDAAGNVQNDTMNSMLYDAENRMTGSSGLATVSYFYDGEGKRVQKAVTGGAITTYVYL
jgi:YD repeat-containing protein